ncbi:hypothetical protein AB0L44_05100 [Nonomuraea wenchangensis]|uniref:hypothetical protein n=1 Tax=Nonomuraea wenchangensis TaxID=568860 RepID=UPI003447460F
MNSRERGPSRASRTALLLVLVAVPLLLVNWFVAALILQSSCVLPYEGGNITECAAGLSEEEMNAVAGLVASALFAVQAWSIIVLALRSGGKKARLSAEG